jgi:hypothetical protein
MGLISFTDSGALMISHHLDRRILQARGIPLELNVCVFSNEQAHFLEYHRANVFRE